MEDHNEDSNSSNKTDVSLQDQGDEKRIKRESKATKQDESTKKDDKERETVESEKRQSATRNNEPTQKVQTKGLKKRYCMKSSSTGADGGGLKVVIGSYTLPGVRYSDDSPDESSDENSDSKEKKDDPDFIGSGTASKRKGAKHVDSTADSSKKKTVGRRKGQPRKILKNRGTKLESGKSEAAGKNKSKSSKTEENAGESNSATVDGSNEASVTTDAHESESGPAKTARRRKGRPRKILNIKDNDEEETEKKEDRKGEERRRKGRPRKILNVKNDEEDETDKKEDGDGEGKPKKSRRNERVMCEKCGKTVSRLYMARHMYHIHSPQTYECDQCRRVLKTEKAYQHHLMVKHSAESPHKCPICGTGLSSSRALSHHLARLHGSPDDKPFQCDVCEKRFLLKNDLQLHMSSHSTEKAFMCETCGKGFNNKGSLKAHRRVHTGEKPYKCQYCDQSFSFKNSLQGHERRHTGETPYLCSFCGKGFPTRPALLKHSIVHSDERPFKCTQCEKTFRSRPAFTTHKDFHLGIKRWECKICKRRFLFQGNMIKHYRRHLPDRPHVCEICGKGFVQSQELKTHMKTHTGESKGNRRKKNSNTLGSNKISAPSSSQNSEASGNHDLRMFVQQAKSGGNALHHDYNFEKPNSDSNACHFGQNQMYAEKQSNVQQNQYKLPNASAPPPYKVPNVPLLSSCCDLPYGNLLQSADGIHDSMGHSAPAAAAAATAAIPPTVMVSTPDEMYSHAHHPHQNNDIEMLQTAVNPYTFIQSSGMPNHSSAAYEADKNQQKCAAASPIIRCKLCNKDFTTNRYIRKHLVEYHRVNNPEDFFYNLG